MKRTVLLFLTILFICIGVGCMNRGYNGFTKKIEEFRNENNPKVVIELDNGKKMYLELFPEVAPITVENFLKLVDDNFYAGIIFHRVIEDFMIQGGDPTGTGMGGSNQKIKGEFLANGVENYIPHVRGVISMARSRDNNSASSQFFICHANAPHLNGSYAAFGYLYEGYDCLDFIAGVKTNYNDKPLVDVTIESIKRV